MLLLLALALGNAQAAITSDRTGGYVDVTAGLGLGGEPAASAGALDFSVGAWRGKYDQELSFGRYWGGGVSIRQHWRPESGLRTAWLLEARRGMDLVVVGMIVIGVIGIAIDIAFSRLQKLPIVRWGFER